MAKKKKAKPVKVAQIDLSRLRYPYNYVLSDEGPMDAHHKLGPMCRPYSFCYCQPVIVYWNPLTGQRSYEHRHRIH